MKSYHTAIEIDAPADMVWEVLLDTESYPEWNPLVSEVFTDLMEEEDAEVYIKPLRQKVKVFVLKRDEGRELRWRGSLLFPQIVAGTHYYILDPIDDGRRTLLKHGEKFTGALSFLIPKIALNHMESAFEEHNRLLKARVERFWSSDEEEGEEHEDEAPERY